MSGHESHDDDHIRALPDWVGGATERRGLACSVDEGPGIGAHEKHVDGPAGALRCDARHRDALDGAEHRVDIEPASDPAEEHQDDQDRDSR